MIISPPFLPDGDVNQSQSSDAFVEQYMQKTGEGNFPVSYCLQWHGGIHLKAPSSTSLVRAIADGKVLYVRPPTEKPKDYLTLEKHPLHNGLDGWSDNGCVVIQHDTEIGENLAVTFYSIYMHLGSIEKSVTIGSDIHRKGKIGKAGIISDQEDQIHFEIIADEENTKKFLGDLAFSAPNYHIDTKGAEKAFQAQNGRTDACFGSMYFYVPQGASICEAQEVEEDKVVSVKNKKTGKTTQETIKVKKTVYVSKKQDNGADMTVGKNIYVEMAFDKGICTFTSYNEDGTLLAGEPVITQGEDSSYSDAVHEYNLYKASLALYPSKPTAGFELLRFGRVIGDENFSATETVTHFRKILTPKGKYWVDLNKSYIKKYSDADFPYWKGWGISNDDINGDSRCDSKIITEIIYNYWKTKSTNAQYIDGYLHEAIKNLQPAEKYKDVPDNGVRAAYLFKTMQSRQDMFATKEVQEQVLALKNIFYKFPTEWSMTDFDKRYAWVKRDIYENSEPGFEKFKNFVKALSFWDEAKMPIDTNHWHFPPIEFIKHFRKCGWLSKYEFRQIIPKQVIRQNGSKYYWEANGNIDFLNNIYVNLNKTLRKYCITTPLRIASFLGNSIQETQWFHSLEELGKGKGKPYFPWYGRGLLQLTWEDNYKIYATFIGDSKNRNQLLITLKDTTELKAADSAGLYWAFKNANQYVDAEKHILERVAQPCVNSAGTHIYYRSEPFWGAACIVNRGSVGTPTYSRTSINGFPDRCCAYNTGLAILTEMKFSNTDGKLLEFPEDHKQRGIKEER